MKKQLVLCFITLFFSFLTQAQTAKNSIAIDVKWGSYTDKKTGRNLGIDGQNKIIYSDDDYLYMLNKPYTKSASEFRNSRLNSFSIIKIKRDKTTPIISQKYSKININGISSNLCEVFNLGENLYTFYIGKDKKSNKIFVSCKEINKNTLKLSERVINLETIEFGDGKGISGFEFSVKKSIDNTKLLLRYNKGARSDKEQVGISVFDVELNSLAKYSHQFEYLNKEMQIISQQISNSGQVSLLANISISGEDTKFQIYNFRKDQAVSAYPLSIKDHHITDIQIGFQGNNLITAGFYNDNVKTSDVKGTFYGKINEESGEINNLVFNEFDIKFIKDGLNKRAAKTVDRKEEKGADATLKNIRMGDLIFTSNGRTILMGETFYFITRRVRVGNTTYTYTDYYYGDLLAISFNNEGKLEWNQKIEKLYSTTDYILPITTTSSVFIRGENLFVIYEGDNASKTVKPLNQGSIIDAYLTKFSAKGEETKSCYLDHIDSHTWVNYLPTKPTDKEYFGLRYIKKVGFSFCKIVIRD